MTATDHNPCLEVPIGWVKADLSDLPDDDGWYHWTYGFQTALVRRIDDRRYMAVIPFIYTHAIVWGYISDCEFGYEDRWCYESSSRAVTAATVWLGPDVEEPYGWHRHPRTGRRRPDGDPEQEYVDP